MSEELREKIGRWLYEERRKLAPLLKGAASIEEWPTWDKLDTPYDRQTRQGWMQAADEMISALGLVELAEDQSLPEMPDRWHTPEGWHELTSEGSMKAAVDTMLAIQPDGTAFRKVKVQK